MKKEIWISRYVARLIELTGTNMLIAAGSAMAAHPECANDTSPEDAAEEEASLYVEEHCDA